MSGATVAILSWTVDGEKSEVCFSVCKSDSVCKNISNVIKMGDAESESILNELLSSSLDETDGSVDIGSPREGNGFHGKPRRSSILSRSNSSRPRVKKSVSFCSMPQDRRVSNGKTFSLQLSMEVQLLLIIAK